MFMVKHFMVNVFAYQHIINYHIELDFVKLKIKYKRQTVYLTENNVYSISSINYACLTCWLIPSHIGIGKTMLRKLFIGYII